MTIDDVVQICNRGLYIICITAAPVLIVSLVVGLIISIFQTVTSIQEQTLTFVPKILAIFVSIIFYKTIFLKFFLPRLTRIPSSRSEAVNE